MQRATLLLKEVSSAEILDSFDAKARPQCFQNSKLSDEVESLQLVYQSPDETEQPTPKRRKVDPSTASGLTALSDMIFGILEPSASSLGGFEEVIV